MRIYGPLQTILLLSLALAGNLGSTGPSQDLCAQDSHPGDNLWGKGVCREEIGSLTNFLPLTTITSPAPGPIATASPNTLQDPICSVLLDFASPSHMECTGKSCFILDCLIFKGSTGFHIRRHN
ncbi:hypothetical protein B0H16DRAFT_1541885 [Mycena metata]|uniref:Uncharacterized protein n=1 Tax=Mycena metata TaxID=1033252 RepID=A0AAD7J2G1_9AGAR|nr:hypothetical protein B0H16DRAFT_1541885 [Mycena metata]